MTIVAIGWAYVVMMMAIAEDTAVAGVMTFLLYGALPVSLILYVGGAGARKRRRALAQSQAHAKASAQSDEQANKENSGETAGKKIAHAAPGEAADRDAGSGLPDDR